MRDLTLGLLTGSALMLAVMMICPDRRLKQIAVFLLLLVSMIGVASR